ncbi:hypothetical protein [Bacillus sp. FJAT-45350]|uniref:hypothetical protein n=1 Tax=Bacillus sp. FJAT-45350 TaxID=2011014 RepID=UPI000BB75C84|nr:hypothetical protein [Bacillus sp. FJAT-45350]
MAITKKERLLQIIQDFESYSSQIPSDMQQKIQQAKQTLMEQSDEHIEQITDNVYSTPANQRSLDQQHPEYVLLSCYQEIERLARKDNTNQELTTVVKELQHYFSIEDKDGYFP